MAPMAGWDNTFHHMSHGDPVGVVILMNCALRHCSVRVLVPPVTQSYPVDSHDVPELRQLRCAHGCGVVKITDGTA